MQINIIAIGKNMPDWVNQAVAEYSKRMPKDFAVSMTELPLIKRSKTTNIEQIKSKESESLLAAVPAGSFKIALDEHGKLWDTKEVAQKLQVWRETYSSINLLIGGPDGLSKECLSEADLKWSLSPLTLPHPLVRVILAEQLYRAWSVLVGHPYHRE